MLMLLVKPLIFCEVESLLVAVLMVPVEASVKYLSKVPLPKVNFPGFVEPTGSCQSVTPSTVIEALLSRSQL